MKDSGSSACGLGSRVEGLELRGLGLGFRGYPLRPSSRKRRVLKSRGAEGAEEVNEEGLKAFEADDLSS